MSFALIISDSEGDKNFEIYLGTREEILKRFNEEVNDMYLAYQPDSEFDYKNYEIQDITKLEAHDYICDRKGYSRFIWIKSIENNSFCFKVESFYDFEPDSVTYKNSDGRKILYSP